MTLKSHCLIAHTSILVLKHEIKGSLSPSKVLHIRAEFCSDFKSRCISEHLKQFCNA